jgi:hypothetical protein
VSYRYPDDLEHALRTLGITRDEMAAEGIQWLGSVKLESPSVFNRLVADVRGMDRYTINWQFAIRSGTYTSYANTRNWNWWMAFREIVQNAMDAQQFPRQLSPGESAPPPPRIRVDRTPEWYIVVQNTGPALTYKAWGFGGSSKTCYERGYFGEGLKVAAAYFAMRGYPLYVFSHGQAFKATVIPESNMVFVVWGIAPGLAPDGTMVIITDSSPEPDVKFMIFQEYVPSDKVLSVKISKTTNCEVGMPNYVAAIPDSLWVRDIFVNRISTITGKPSLFSYDLWWVKLDPNRTTVSSLYNLIEQASRSLTSESAAALLNAMLVSGRFGRYDGLRDDVFESDFYKFSDDVIKVATDWCKSRNYVVSPPSANLDWIQYIIQDTGKSILVVPSAMMEMFDYDVRAEVVYAQSMKQLTGKTRQTVANIEMQSIRRQSTAGAIRVLYSLLSDQFGVSEPKVGFAENLGSEGTAGVITREKEIFIRLSDLDYPSDALGTAVHEFAHYVSGARDVMAEFEQALTRISGVLVGKMSESYAYAIGRAVNKMGLVSPESMEEYLHRFLDHLDDTVRKMEDECDRRTSSGECEEPEKRCQFTHWMYHNIRQVASGMAWRPEPPDLIMIDCTCDMRMCTVDSSIVRNIPPTAGLSYQEQYRRDAMDMARTHMRWREDRIFGFLLYNPFTDMYESLCVSPCT